MWFTYLKTLESVSIVLPWFALSCFVSCRPHLCSKSRVSHDDFVVRHLEQSECCFTSGPRLAMLAEQRPVRPRTLTLSPKVLVQSDHWHFAFLCSASGFSMGGLRGAEASAWFSRVKTKRLLKIPRSSHDPRKDPELTCVGFPFCRLWRTKSTHLTD